MFKQYLTAILTVLAVLAGGPAVKAAPWGDYLIACGDGELYIINVATSTAGTPDVLWHWNVFESYGQLPDEVRHHMRTLDDCKPVDDGKHLLLM